MRMDVTILLYPGTKEELLRQEKTLIDNTVFKVTVANTEHSRSEFYKWMMPHLHSTLGIKEIRMRVVGNDIIFEGIHKKRNK